VNISLDDTNVEQKIISDKILLMLMLNQVGNFDFFYEKFFFFKASRNFKVKQHEFYSTEVNRNGRTAFLIDQYQKMSKNETSTSTNEFESPKILSNKSSVNNIYCFYYLLSVLICWIRPV
jgi:hypothetical protein